MAESLTCEAIVDGGMIEHYLAGLLSEAEVEAFESHYLTCARCQNELRLAVAIRDVLPEVREVAQGPDVSRAALAGHWLRRHAGVGAVAAAIAAVLAGVLIVQPGTRESLQHREPVPETADAPRLEAPIGEVRTVAEFRWAPTASADLYKLTLYNAAGDVVWETDTRATHVALPDSLRLEPGALYLWQVNARVDWDRWVNSELVQFRVPEP